VLAETLAGAGIKITGKVLRDRTIRGQLPSNMSATDSRADSTWTLLAVHETPLPQVVTRANKDSVSVYVESLCKRLGFAVTGQSGSWSSGTAAVGAFLAKVGVDGRLYHLDDGCGLSKEDVVAAHAIVSVLIYDHFAGQKDVFFNSLSVAGSDGTLVKRFRRSDLRDRVFAKSGSMNDVSNLSGYLHAKDDQWYVFSILMNGFPIGSIAEARGLQEAIVEALDNSVGTSGPIAMPP
jgi:D-alanyl-D-alanine carboxypeptidase/D-alanyl-D-alanine-endopeptidase (penicillin-binding protein 4)